MSNSFPYTLLMSDELRSLLVTSLSTAKFMVINPKFSYGQKLKQYEVLTAEELEIFEKRVKNTAKDAEFELSEHDLLIFYTALEVSIKCFLSDAASNELKQITIKHNNSTPEQFDEVRKFYMILAGRFIEGIRNDFKDNKTFKEHLKKLEIAAL